MSDVDQKLNYELISENIQSAQHPDFVFKISVRNKPHQIPELKLFTQNEDFIFYLRHYGFISGPSLIDQVISCIGQAKANELLIRKDLENTRINLLRQLRNKTIADSINNTDQKIKNSAAQSILINKLQNKILSLKQKEPVNNYIHLKNQCAFKLELSLIIQKYITKIKKNSSLNEYSEAVNAVLYRAINLIDDYEFPTKNYTEDIQGGKRTYLIEPNKLGRLQTIDDIMKFYLCVDNFNNISNLSSPQTKIKDSEILKIEQLREKSSTKILLNNLLHYIKTHSWRTILFFILVVAELIFLPFIAPVFRSYYLLNLIGLGKPFLLITFSISFTLPLINKIAELPNNIKLLYKSIYKKFFKKKPSMPKTSIKPPAAKFYYTLLDDAIATHISFSAVPKPKNLIWHIPMISSFINYVSRGYQNYCNWYFSYIQRNPVGFAIYIILVGLSIFFRALYLPISQKLYGTYVNIDRSIDRHRNQHSSSTEDLESCSKHTKPPHVYKFFTIILIVDLTKLLIIKAPVAICYMISKILIASIYLICCSCLNLLLLPCIFLQFKFINNFLLDCESKLSSYYYNIYYNNSYYYKRFNAFVDSLDFEQYTKVMPANMHSSETVDTKIMYLNRTKQAKNPSISPGEAASLRVVAEAVPNKIR